MTDRLLARAWWLATMMLIVVTGGGAMFVAYEGVFYTFAASYINGAIYTLAAIPLGVACYLLCRHRADLVCD